MRSSASKPAPRSVGCRRLAWISLPCMTSRAIRRKPRVIAEGTNWRAAEASDSAHARKPPSPGLGGEEKGSCGLPTLESNTRKVADSLPTMEGVKNTVNVQVPAGGSEPPQGGSLPLALTALPRMPPVMGAAVRVTVVGAHVGHGDRAGDRNPDGYDSEVDHRWIELDQCPDPRQVHGLRAGRIAIRSGHRTCRIAAGSGLEFGVDKASAINRHDLVVGAGGGGGG